MAAQEVACGVRLTKQRQRIGAALGVRKCVEALEVRRLLAIGLAESQEPPTAVFHAVGATSVGQAGRVRFSSIADEAADMAAGHTFSYDLDGDGVYEVAEGTSPEAEVPAEYLSTPGAWTVHGRIADQGGASSEYETKLIINDQAEWCPLRAGLSYSSRSYQDEALWDLTTRYEVDTDGGLVALETRRFASNPPYDDASMHLISEGTTWYTTLIEYPQAWYTDHTPMQPTSPVPTWDEGIAQGKVLSWSGIGITPPAEPGVVYSAPMLTQGTIARVKSGTVVLKDKTRFEGAMLVQSVMTGEVSGSYEGQPIHITMTVTEKTWYVQGIGLVKSTTVGKGSLRYRSRTLSVGTTRDWEELTGIPDWSRFTAVSNGTLHVQGTGDADKIRASVAGTDLLVYRNGVINRVPLASVQRVLVAPGDGNDVVDLRNLGLPVTVEGGTGNDTIYGGSAGDLLDGQEGSDRIYGNGGDDVLLGGDGDDRLYGGSGSDSLTGAAGADLLLGQGGNDRMDGHDGVPGETINGGAGTDTAYVDAGEKAGAVETRVEGATAMVLGEQDRVEAVLGRKIVREV